jgi:hypothetical protein
MSYITLSDLRGMGEVYNSDVQSVAGLLLAARGPISVGNVGGAVTAWSAAAARAAMLVGAANMPKQAGLAAALAGFAGAAQGHATASGLTASDLQGDQDELEKLLNVVLAQAGMTPTDAGMSTTAKIGIGVAVAAVVLGAIWYGSQS